MSKKYLLILGSVALLLLGIGGWVFWSSREESQTSFSNIPQEEPAQESAPTGSEPAREPGVAGEMSEVTEVEKEEGVRESAESEKSEDEKVPADETKPAEKKPSNSMPKVTSRLMDSGYRVSSGRKIDTIVIHSSYDALGDEPYSVSGLIKEYEEYGVSAHYLIDRQGTIYQLVKDKDVSYHAGTSRMPDGRTNVNEFSIGIELMNTKEDEYTKAQYDALQHLVDGLKNKYPINSVLGHDEIAPDRKTDPWNFDWKKLKK